MRSRRPRSATNSKTLIDEGLRAFNVERIHAGDVTSGDSLVAVVSSLVAAARTLPMMAPRRLVIVLQADALLVPKRESEAATRALEELEALFKEPGRRRPPSCWSPRRSTSAAGCTSCCSSRPRWWSAARSRTRQTPSAGSRIGWRRRAPRSIRPARGCSPSAAARYQAAAERRRASAALRAGAEDH